MSNLRSHSLSLIESYAEASAANREGLVELRRLAALDQDHARAVDRWFLAIQDWTLSANALFAIQSEMDQALRSLWYQLGGPYDAAKEVSLVANYRLLVESSEELLGDIALLTARGRAVKGAEECEEHVRQAREILEDDEIRQRALDLIRSLDKLDSLADAHNRSIGH